MRMRSSFLPGVLALTSLAAILGRNPSSFAQAQAPTPSPQKDAARTRDLTLEERGDIFMARKSYIDAVDYYYRALKQSNFSSPTIWNKLGIAYQQQVNHKAARKAYSKAIHLRKDFSEAYNNVGTTYYLENKYRKSLKYYRRAIEIDPNNATYHLNLGSSLYSMKKYPEAVQEYQTALSLNPNVLTERSTVGTVMQARGTDPRFYFYMAKVFASLGRVDEAVRYLRRAFEDGFKDQKKLQEDPDFQKISSYPAYVELLNNPPVPIQQ